MDAVRIDGGENCVKEFACVVLCFIYSPGIEKRKAKSEFLVYIAASIVRI